MRPRWSTANHVVLVTAFVLLVASLCNASLASTREPLSVDVGVTPGIVRRGGHGHHDPHSSPLVELNETEVTMYHAPTPESYYTVDWEGSDHAAVRHPGLLIMHAVAMSLAFFVALPMSIALRSVKHALHGIAMVSFYGLCALGCATSSLYTKLTPNMYEGSIHGSHGYKILFLAISLSAIDILVFTRRLVVLVRSSETFNLKTLWNTIVLGRNRERGDAVGPECTGLVAGEMELEEYDDSGHKGNLNSVHSSMDLSHRDTADWANNLRNHHHQRQDSQSAESDGTLFAPPSPLRSINTHNYAEGHGRLTSKVGLLTRIGNGTLAVLERSLVLAGFGQLLTGIVIYTGGCRENYVNGCLAHLISAFLISLRFFLLLTRFSEGGIFWCYGLLSFGRFLGSFAELGWAWNRAPIGHFYSAEFVESFVIFLYGSTNMWMERFGANPGDPFTTKQIQHIGIAVMFCFAGLLGMGIESKQIRTWLASSTFASVPTLSMSQDAVAEPPSYGVSFNPFPALVIGVTGAAMAAHKQTYLFQVQIHTLWGSLLVGFSVVRCLTYFFMWLGPPRSILPSRPPTEALGSFFLACGGLLFMFSTEELTIAAMRRGRDDVMMFMNVAVAITCFAFCWTLSVVGFKSWLKSRTNPVVSYPASA